MEHGRHSVATILIKLEQVPPEKRLVFLDAIAALDARMVPVPKAPWWFG